MSDQDEATKPQGKHGLVATVAVPPDWADLQGAERAAAVRNLARAITAAVVAATPEIAEQIAAEKAAAETAAATQGAAVTGENEARHD